MPSLAWNANGHRLSAAIAYSELSPKARAWARTITPNFIQDSVWADKQKQRGVRRYNHWHYINLPDRTDGIAKPRMRRQHVVWIINKAQCALMDPRVSLKTKRFYLRFLIHAVADVHQPMHAIERYSRRFRYGDAGGNQVPINSPIADNLHSYWDRGGGYLLSRRSTRMVDQLKARYPKKQFGKALKVRNPYAFARESHQIARQFAYTLKAGQKPSLAYQRKTQRMTQRQLVLSGYRLADMLNRMV